MSDTPAIRKYFAARSAVRSILRQRGAAWTRSRVSLFLARSPLGVHGVAWYLRVKGNMVVGALLATLPLEWSVFHALSVGSKVADVDHLVIGPGGVFTINSEYHRGKYVWVDDGTVMVEGRNLPYIRNAEVEAQRITALLRERVPMRDAVRAVVALVAPKVLVVRGRHTQVKVVEAQDLREWLVTLPTVLGPGERMQLAAAIADPTTWGVPSSAADNKLPRFTTRDAELRSARMQRAFWGPLLTVTTFGGAIFVAIHFGISLGDLIASFGH